MNSKTRELKVPFRGFRGKKKIVILGDFNPQYYTHRALNDAIFHLSNAVNHEVSIEWMYTDRFDYSDAFTSIYSGLWVAPSSPYKDMENVLNAIRYAREQDIPTIGNCGGFQHMIIEFARNVCGLTYADTEELHPGNEDLIISILSCSLVGKEEDISILESSFLHSLVGTSHLKGKYHCSYALNPDYIPMLESHGMKMTAKNSDGDIRAFELSTNSFYIATLFQPALTSTEDEPDPILMAFVNKIVNRESKIQNPCFDFAQQPADRKS